MEFYPFGLNNNENAGSVDLLGGKGAGLVWLASEGVPVPPGFVIPTSVWAEYDKKPKGTMKAIAKALPSYLAKLEQHFGYLPLLSVRSGSRVSCPGMMDTILNVGIEGANTTEWINRLGPACFADSFKRLVTMYGTTAASLDKGWKPETLKDALDGYQAQLGVAFPSAQAQLLGAIEAVFKSWDNDRADVYRKMHGYDRAWGTAVTVQAMVFGNLNDNSGSGVLFTRNPNTGERVVTGEFLPNAQGEDVVNGSRTPLPLDEMKNWWNPLLHGELVKLVGLLEVLKKDVQDIEFTIQDGKLYLLQVRNAKRTATAALRIAVEMAKENLIDAKTAVQRISARQFDQAQLATVDEAFTVAPAFTGLPACSGVVTGKPVFTKEEAIECKESCILVTEETTPDDIAGMRAAVGVVTMKGGATCHAAVVARSMNRACVVGVGQSLEAFKDIEVLSLDGATGRIWTEKVPTVGGHANGAVTQFSQFVCETLGVVPVIFDVPTQPMAEALLYLGDNLIKPEALGMVLKSLNKVDRLYLDLVPSADEQPFLNIVGAYDHTGLLLAKLEAFLADQPAKKAKLVVIVDAKYTSTFERITPGSDLRSIVLSDKEIVLDGVDTTDPAIERVLAWKANEGVSVVSLGAYVAGAKSMVSVSAALQILGKAV